MCNIQRCSIFVLLCGLVILQHLAVHKLTRLKDMVTGFFFLEFKEKDVIPVCRFGECFQWLVCAMASGEGSEGHRGLD